MKDPTEETLANLIAVGIERVPVLTGIPRSAVFELIRTGELKTFKVGRRRLVSTDVLREFIRTREAA
jgi:excisionase family DNA binding protein